MERVPKGWLFTFGLSVLAVVAAIVASNLRAPAQAEGELGAEADSCFRYGRVECCVKD